MSASEPDHDQMGANCGNPRHPDGAWHPAAPLPFGFILREPDTWTRKARAERRAYRRNVKAWGCGCPLKEHWTRCQSTLGTIQCELPERHAPGHKSGDWTWDEPIG